MFLNNAWGHSNLVGRVIFPSETIARTARQLTIQWFPILKLVWLLRKDAKDVLYPYKNSSSKIFYENLFEAVY